MSKTRMVYLWNCLFGILLIAGVAVTSAQSEPEADQSMSAEQQAMMKAWQKAMTPGAPQAALARQAGTWNVTVRSWMPGLSEPQISEGKSERNMILGGRVLMERVEGTSMGQPFSGLGLTGYDNVKGEYWSVWTDNMSTALYTSTGSCDEAHTKCDYMMTGTDPFSGKEMKSHGVFESIGTDAERATMYDVAADGSEKKSMEMTYERTMPSQAVKAVREKAEEIKEKMKKSDK